MELKPAEMPNLEGVWLFPHLYLGNKGGFEVECESPSARNDSSQWKVEKAEAVEAPIIKQPGAI